MKKFSIVTLPLLAAFVVLGAGCQLFEPSAQVSHPIVMPTTRPEPQKEPTQQVTSTPSVAMDNVYENKDTSTQVSFEGDRTVVRKPFLSNPFIFNGTTTVFENQFAWRVKDGKKNVVAGGSVYAKSPDVGQPGPFRVIGLFDKLPKTKDGVFELYDESPKDGSDVILIAVPITFVDLAPQQVTVYFGNKLKDPKMLDCSKVFPVTRDTVAVTFQKQSEQASIHQLLLGPTEKEKKAGYFSSLPENINQPDIYWSETGERRLTVDFDSTLEAGVAGSCRVSAIRAQIEKTVGLACLKGMCAIAVNHKTEGILQP